MDAAGEDEEIRLDGIPNGGQDLGIEQAGGAQEHLHVGEHIHGDLPCTDLLYVPGGRGACLEPSEKVCHGVERYGQQPRSVFHGPFS